MSPASNLKPLAHPAWTSHWAKTRVEIMQFGHYLWIVSAALVGTGAGWLLDRIVLGRLRRFARNSQSIMDNGLVSALKGILPLWGALVTVWLTERFFDLPASVVDPTARLLLGVTVFSFCLVATRMASSWIQHTTSGLMGGTKTASIMGIIMRATIYTVGALVVLHDLGIAIAPMITALGVGGLAIALALQDTLTNLFAGLQLIASRQVKVGDYVKLDSGEEGYLSDITWRNTMIRALSNHLIVVPNAKLASAIVQNLQLPDPAVSVVMQVGVSYDSDLYHVEEVTIATARKVVRRMQPTLSDFDPFIRYHTFGESSIGFSVILRASEFAQRFELMHEFIKALHLRYREEGIVIPYPIRTLQMDHAKQMQHEQ